MRGIPEAERTRVNVRFRSRTILIGGVAAIALMATGGGAARAPGPDARPQLSATAVAAYKASHDTQGAYIRSVAARYAQASARKMAMFRKGQLRAARQPGMIRPMLTSGSGWAYLYLNQQGEKRNYWCGPATVSMMALTVPGPSYVDQATAASWMGTTTDGTSVSQETSGLQHFVGQPDYGTNFYYFVFMDGNPTSAQRSAFLDDLQVDVSLNSPVAGNAWEVPGGPHLVGHPNQTIFHWFEIGGWNTNNGTVYYADPATSVWSSVPPLSWFDTYTLETILGGRGYAW
jgi:hypothetical protein